MKRNISKKWMLIAPIIFGLPIVLLTSCVYKPTPHTNNFASTIWERANTWATGEIVSWKDGDTVEVKMQMKGVGEFEIKSIRIAGIDTPETKEKKGNDWVDSKEPELTFAKNATDFAKKTIPIGSKVKIWFNATNGVPEKSYDRLVGNIFYGENFSKSYEVAAIANGWSVPTFDKVWIREDYRSEHYLAREAALAFNEAYYEKKGIHENRDNSTVDYIAKIFTTRGDGDYEYIYFFINKDHPLSNKKDNFWMLEESKSK